MRKMIIKQDNITRRNTQRDNVDHKKQAHGSVSKMHPVVIEEGRMIVYIRDPRREAEVRSKYTNHITKLQ